jgi:hypothetical protein
MKTNYKPTLNLIDHETRTHIAQCDHPDCIEEGHFRAPRTRDLRNYYWFCLEHVRKYNASWNYYKGMDENQIEYHRRDDITWQRPTWPLGGISSQKLRLNHATFSDPFRIFKKAEQNKQKETFHQTVFPPQSAEAKALIIMDLNTPLSIKVLKIRYKELVKKYHPDRNKGCKVSEDKMKAITQAFAVLKKAGEI